MDISDLPHTQQKVMTSILAGKRQAQAAEAAGVSHEWVKKLCSNQDPVKTEKFYTILQEEKRKQRERLLGDADEQKMRMILKWEQFEEKASNAKDLNNEGKAIEHQGKIAGVYVSRIETEDKTPIKKRKRDLSKLSVAELKTLRTIEDKILIEEE